MLLRPQTSSYHLISMAEKTTPGMLSTKPIHVFLPVTFYIFLRSEKSLVTRGGSDFTLSLEEKDQDHSFIYKLLRHPSGGSHQSPNQLDCFFSSHDLN